MVKNSVSVPIEIILGNELKNDNNAFSPFRKISVKNKYNFLDENNNIVSDIWFTKISDYKSVNGDIIVVKKGSVYNILNKDKSFVFNDWYYYIERINNYDNLIAYKVYDKTRHFRLYTKEKGFIGENYYKDCLWINTRMYALINEDNTAVLYDSKTNSIYDNILYDYIDSTSICNSLVIVNKENKYNILNENNTLLFKEWSTEEPKRGIVNCKLIIFGDKKNGYYLINEYGTIINENNKFDNVICSELRNGYFEPLKDNLIIARKDKEFILFDPNGNLVEKKNISLEDINLNELLEIFIVKKILKI